jgi:hypothetical protein
MKRICRMCGGPLMILGLLGSVRHFRCRNCGMVFAWTIKRCKTPTVSHRAIHQSTRQYLKGIVK